MIPNIVFALGLSPTAGWVYAKLKWKAGANLDSLPSQERRISKLLGISRSMWSRNSKELRHFGLIRIEGKAVVLTYIDNITWRYFTGKITLNAAKSAIQALGEKGARDIQFGPDAGQDSGPDVGQKSGPDRGHMINNMKNKNMGPRSSSPKVPMPAQGSQADDDDSNWISGGDHRQKVVWLFTALSNSTAWRHARDDDDYQKISQIPWRIIAMAMCYTVSKLASHKMGSLKVAIDQIQSHAKEMDAYAESDLDRIVRPVFQRTRRCMRLGKWDLSEMTAAEQDEVLRRDSRKVG